MAPRPQKIREDEYHPYLPTGPKPNVFEQFKGINTSTSRPGVPDEQAYWLDGFMPIGPRFLRTMYDVGEPIEFEDEAPIAFFKFINIGSTRYAIVIHTDGSIHAANTDTYAQSEIAPAGTISSPSVLNVGISQYGSQYALIVSSQTNGYFIWDGATFYSPGEAIPAVGTVPTGISGTGIETYQGRVWIINDDAVTFSAPGSFIDFTAGSGGGNFESTDSFLKDRFIGLVQTNGFLYLIADSSINYISNVQTSGSPPTTTFTNQNADPEVGTPWPPSITTFGRNIIFANAFGAHVNYGAAVSKISEPLDGVYNTADNFGGIIPSSAKAILFGKKCWVLLLPIIDPVSGQQVNKLFLWDGDSKRWWASEQSINLIYIQSQEIDSILTAWGTDGADIYPLFQEPSDAFEKIAQSKLWDAPVGYNVRKAAVNLWGLAYYYSLNTPNLTVSIDNENGPGTGDAEKEIPLGPLAIRWTNNSGDTIAWTNNAVDDDTLTWFGSGTGIAVIPPTVISQAGFVLGMTASTMAADMALISLAFQPEPHDYAG